LRTTCGNQVESIRVLADNLAVLIGSIYRYPKLFEVGNGGNGASFLV
jgi:hypothetical protein